MKDKDMPGTCQAYAAIVLGQCGATEYLDDIAKLATNAKMVDGRWIRFRCQR